MVAKLCPDVLDKLDIFILEIEELEIPKVPSKLCILKTVYCYDVTIHYGCAPYNYNETVELYLPSLYFKDIVIYRFSLYFGNIYGA